MGKSEVPLASGKCTSTPGVNTCKIKNSVLANTYVLAYFL